MEDLLISIGRFAFATAVIHFIIALMYVTTNALKSLKSSYFKPKTK